MKIGRLTDGSTTYWAALQPDEESVRPLAGPIASWGPRVTADGSDGAAYDGEVRPLAGLRLVAPAQPDAKVVCLGATYAKHVVGLGRAMTGQPAGFWKPFDALIGPGDDIVYPAITEGLDFEVELVMVIGSARVDRDAPLAAVLGYTVGNDISLRDLQFKGSVTGMDMFSAKSAERSTPLGPWIVTRDEFGEGSPDLLLTLTVNGEKRQSERTSAMSFGLDALVRWADERTTLRAGDVVYTGTPHGVAHEDGRYLQPGDVVEATVEGLGTLRNTVGPRTTAGSRG
jgi:2-keto-4-pentenoate hydratase/2-oxohepta-3-ene-1,7-dioic acid hydratase in catechol pathway